jgi:hypothetical protein
MMGTTENIFSRDSRVSAMLTKLQEQILDSRRLAHKAKYKDVFSKSSCITYTLRFLRVGLPCTYVQDVRYAGFAGRLYGCSRLITSGTSYLAKTGHKKSQFLDVP